MQPRTRSAKLQAGRFLSLSVVVRVTLHRRAAERVRALEVREIGEARTIVRDDEVLALALVAAARHVNVSRSRFERVVEQVAERRSVRVVLGCVPNSAKVQPRGRSLARGGGHGSRAGRRIYQDEAHKDPRDEAR